MQSFTNKFSIALNQDKTEAIINFYQNIPMIPEDGSNISGEIPSQIIPVASLAMTGQCARNFAKALNDLLEQETSQ